MLRALANYLHGRDFPMLGRPHWSAPVWKTVARAVARLPNELKEQVYIWSGRYEAIRPEKLHEARTDKIAEWVTGLYPKRKYPAIAVGSSNGALTHLWAALGVPWLPQTFLIPVARSGPHPDEPAQDIEWAKDWVPVFLEANPDVQLHHMHDPNQDRLMIQRMTYFRVKRLRVGEAYENFIRESLEPGGTIFIVECGLKCRRPGSASGIFFSSARSAARLPRNIITAASAWRSISAATGRIERGGNRRRMPIGRRRSGASRRGSERTSPASPAGTVFGFVGLHSRSLRI
jgi:hypothetical protein